MAYYSIVQKVQTLVDLRGHYDEPEHIISKHGLIDAIIIQNR